MKRTWIFCLLFASSCALAQAPVTYMPEGTKDVSLGLALGSTQRAAGSDAKQAFLVPQFSVLWSNGVFLEGLNLGMHLSREPYLQYGPTLFFEHGPARADKPDQHSKKRLVPGAFLNYQLLHNLSLHSSFSYGLTPERDGLLVKAGATYSMPIAERQSISVGAGLEWASRDYMQAYFGVTPEQASAGSAPVYAAASGIKNVNLRASWRWQLSRKYTLTTAFQTSQLRGSAATSPLTQSRTGQTYYTSLMYRF